ncbi:M56 family metallopeptidase [Paenibacillus filicis]|uniref:M56 family metallopeptidase n=1 Tax=Paenibacillus filicis TaxID=669464 RepID=A0ABU9DSQ6_9BACL
MIKWLLMASLSGSIASLCLILLKSKLAAAYGGRWYYCVCLSALLLFLVPIPIPIQLPALLPQSLIPEQGPTGWTGNPVAATETKAPLAPVPSDPVVKAETFQSSALSAEAWILVIWISGFVIMLSLYLFNYFRFKRQALSGIRIDRVGKLDVRVSDYVHSPMLIGFIKPQIVFPNTKMTVEDYQLALKHESIHHKQKDAWLKLFAVIVNCLHWFNPVSYIALANISEACEYAVDEALSKTMKPVDKKRYSEMILHFASQTSPALNSGLAQPKKQLYRRFKLIMSRGQGRGRTGVGIGAVVMIVAVSLISSSVVFAKASQPVTEFSGGIRTYYNVNDTLEGNVQSTFGKTRMAVFVGELYIDKNGLRVDSLNRSEPYYKVGMMWKDKSDAVVASMTQQTLSVQDRTVTVAFDEKATSYKDDSVIKKMITNQIDFELTYTNKRLNDDHTAFIDEVIRRGVYVIYEVLPAKAFKFSIFQTENGDRNGSKMLTAYDKKAKMTDIFNDSVKLPRSVLDRETDGSEGIQLGKSFTLKSGETLAFDVKETTDMSPSVSLAVIDEATGEVAYWNPLARSGTRSIFTPGENRLNRSFKIIASGEAEDTAKVEIFTYQTGKEEIEVSPAYVPPANLRPVITLQKEVPVRK